MTPQDQLRVLHIAFRSSPDGTGGDYATRYNDQWKHWSAAVPDGCYQIEGGAFAYEVKAERLVKVYRAGSPAWPESVTVLPTE